MEVERIKYILWILFFRVVMSVEPIRVQEIIGGIGLREKGCRNLCQQDFMCAGYSENINNIALTSCIHAYHTEEQMWDTTSVYLPDGYYDLIEKDWSDLRYGGVVCSPYMKQCVMCPEFPVKWIENVGPNYIVYILQTCNITTANDLYSSNIISYPQINNSIKVPYNNITIISVGGGIVQTPVCPLFVVTEPTSINLVSIINLTLQCPQKSHSGIRITKVPKIYIRMQNINVDNVLSSVLVVGGNTGTGVLTPYSTIDITGSKFQNINAYASSYSSPAAISIANFEGYDILLSDFAEDQLIVCQALLNDTGLAPSFTIEGTFAPRIFNISRYTEIFGSMYEVMYYNMGSYEKDNMSITLGIILLYQFYFLMFMLSLLFILHQDILYYVYKKKKLNKPI